jgi:hypothetical protein
VDAGEKIVERRLHSNVPTENRSRTLLFLVDA